MCLNTIIRWFNPEDIDPPKKETKISITDLSALLLDKFPNTQDERVSRVYLDRSSYLTSKDEYMKFIHANDVDKGIYITDKHDCDDFAIALWGALKSSQQWSKMAFGLIFVHWEGHGNHAVNFFVDSNMDVYYVEPQTDEVWLVEDKGDFDPYFYIV